MQTNRLKFQDVDESGSVGQPSAVQGFAVINAPKGTTIPQFIEAQDTNSILNLFGAPSSAFPSIQEVINFNEVYGVWVSAPPGSIAGTSQNGLGVGNNLYSYFGGVYVTTLGSLENFYQVPENIDGTPAINNQILCISGNTSSPFTTTSLNESYSSNTLLVDKITPAYIQQSNIVNVILTYPRNDGTQATITFTVDANNNLNTINPTGGGSLVGVGSISASNIYNGFQKITINANAAYAVTIGATTYNDLNFTNATLNTYLNSIIGSGSLIIEWVYQIPTYVIMSVYQSSCRQTTGTFNLSMMDLRTTVNSQTNPNYNTMTFTYTETSYGTVTYSKAYQVSTSVTGTDGFGNSIYALDVFTGDAFLQAAMNIVAGVQMQFYNTANGVTWGTPTASLLGTRAVLNSAFVYNSMIDQVLQTGWNIASDPLYQNTDLFMDFECRSTLATTLANLRLSPYMFSTFITGIKVSNPVATSASDSTAATSAIVSARSTYPNQLGLAYYCNEFLIKETYNGTSYYNIPLGAVGVMLAQIMEKRLGGAAPMWTNENGFGGQINQTVKRQKYSFSATDADTLDAAGVNPIILDPFYGVMILSQRTAQTPVQLTDNSYLGHQMAFDLFQAEIRQDVMIPQIGKLIDTAHMTLRQNQAQIILNKRLSGPTKIWTDGEVDVADVNTPETLAQNNFMMRIRVKVTPFSEFVTLIFVNVGQTSSVNQVQA